MGLAPRIVYRKGDHVCSFFTDPKEQLVTAVEYIRGGLERAERCLYVCCEHTVDDFRAALRTAGIDVDHEEARGALQLFTREEGHLKGGHFDPDAMISLLEQAVADALAAGFTGLCAAGDMTWLLDGAPGSERVAEYEARLNRFYATHKALGLCQYNRRKLSTAHLDHGIATHRFVRVDGPLLLENPFYERDDEAMRRRPAEPAHVEEKLVTIPEGRARA